MSGTQAPVTPEPTTPKTPAMAAPTEEQQAALKESQAAASIGAQIILDFNSQAGLGARGGASGDMVGNQEARDQDLVAIGLDPLAPSGPPPSPEVLAKRRADEEKRLAEVQEEAPQQSGKATQMSSLAAGIIQQGDTPPNPPEPAEEPPVNTEVPLVTQDGVNLSCTMGIWDGEPTSYAYQWKVDGADVGDGTASYAVQAADIGKVGSCVVTATNAAGSAAAPPSNDVTIA